MAARDSCPETNGVSRRETEVSVARANANRDRHTALATALRAAWRKGDQSWLDLAGIALEMLKPGSAKADAVFIVELHPDGHSSVSTHAHWGGDPQVLLSRAIAALRAEEIDLANCPMHASAASPATGSVQATDEP